MLSEEQTKEIKSQLIQHIDSTFPEDKKASAKQQVEEMNGEQLDKFLEQNNLIKEGQPTIGEQQSVFRSIVNGQIHSYKIDEDQDSLAVLEINPVSKGHIILIPKQEINSVEKMPKSVFALAEKISKRFKSKLKPKEVKIVPSNAFGEFILNVFPVYENESLNSQRYHAEELELQEFQKKLEKKVVKKILKKETKKIPENKIRLPRRIP
ncbi:HIT domain-containing protein [Candidatus Pacearchaeota archaeon]|nr:HIT domain-containing protein [Candidatus Pacearchaeota archaeon]